MVRRSSLALEAKVRCDLPQRGHYAGAFLVRDDEIQEPFLLLGQPGHSVHMDTIHLSPSVNFSSMQADAEFPSEQWKRETLSH